MNEIYQYVEQAFAKIPASAKKTELMQDIAERLQEHAARLMEQGKSPEDAMNKAIVDFGNLSEIAEELKGAENAAVPEQKGMNALWFSIIGSLAIIALMIFINFYYGDGNQTIWFVYPAFGIVWWPLGIFFFGKWRKNRK